VRSLYVPDPLGSTVALLDNTQTKSDTFSYWPYGENDARTGTTPTPFQFVGTAGNYTDGPGRTYYVRRNLNLGTARSLQVHKESTWAPRQSGYGYSALAGQTSDAFEAMVSPVQLRAALVAHPHMNAALSLQPYNYLSQRNSTACDKKKKVDCSRAEKCKALKTVDGKPLIDCRTKEAKKGCTSGCEEERDLGLCHCCCVPGRKKGDPEDYIPICGPLVGS